MRSLVRCVPSAAAMLQCLVATYLLLSKVIPVSCTNAEGSCPSVVYLTVGEKGKIPCLCGNFTIVSWYIGEEHEAGRYPVINYDKVQKRGYGYTAGEYDIEENGTLIIMTVKRQHEGYFVVTVADDIQRREETINIEVIVIVPAVPSYPVVNDKISQQHVYMDVNTDGMLRCAMFGVHPAINLTWTSQSNKISFQNDDLIKTPRENDTFDISLTTHYSVTDLTLERVTIYCEVADEIAEYFPDKAIVDLLLSSLYPVVNGHINQEHVYLDVEREGYLTCLKENVDVGTRLVWELLDPTMQDRVTFQSARVISENNDGTVNINQTVHYKIDYSVKRIMFECRVMEPDTNKHPLATKVDLLFENVYPVVNGHISQEHVYLEVEREGYLTCLKENVDVGTRLVWELLDPTMQDRVTFQSVRVISNNIDGTVNINQTFDYEVNDISLERITVECKVMEPDTDPLVTRVDLLFQDVYPVVNGHISQEHVYLEVEREGYLTCLKENVDVGTRLVWELLDPTMQDRVTFQSVRVISNNIDGTVNINQTFDYEVNDISLERITVECKVMEPDTDPLVTRVDLLFQDVYPVVNGHISQEHVYLEVEREGYLTCLKENVDVGTRLVWELLDPTMQDRVTFQSVRVISNNIDGTVNINQTFDYEVNDISLERITVECKVMEPDTDPLVTRVDLLFQDVYPVVNGHISQEHVYLEVEREGYLTCLKENVDVGTRLVWELLDPTMQDRVTFQSVRVISNNIDGTVNINQTFDYEVNDISLERITVECKVMEPDTDPLATKVDLLFQNVYPVVNGRVNQNHVHLDVDREGHLTCWKENVDVGTRLVWQVLDSTMRDKITFHSNQVISNNNDGTININQTFDYVVHDKSLERIAIECGVVEPNTAQHPFVTRVELLFDEVYPVVNGRVNQNHVHLDVDREGHLTCWKENVDVGTRLVWQVLDSTMRDKITFHSNQVISNNNDGTININQTFDYVVHDKSLERIAIECGVVEPNTAQHPFVTRVELLFDEVYPVVNGRVNQNHVHLDVDREGHLTCWKENVDVGTRLVWQVLDSTMRDKITFHSNQVISNNNDGTININQTFDYVVHDKSLERIAIECGVVEPNTAQHPFVTRVELLFDEAPSPLPVPTIYGCYHQLDHCVLEVEMTGELTCTVRNSYQLVDLKWTTLGRDQMYMVFEESKVNFMNYTDFFDISITTPYTVIDESVTSVNVRCDACRSDSGEVLSSAKTSLLIQTASDSNNNYKSSHFGVSLSTLLLIIGLVLIVIILWYCNRKMYMRSEGKCSGILCTGSRPGNEYGYPIPEATINENPPCTVGGLPVMCSRDVCATDAPEGPEKAESTDFPDSGNSSSLSTEQSGSEPSEKCGLMEDVQMSCIYSKQGSMDGKRGCSEGDQMA